jgi:hypothetical protein
MPRRLTGPGGHGITSLGDLGPVCATELGRSARPSHWAWLHVSLAVSFVLLAPWSGLCERRSRVADPTTCRLETVGARDSDGPTGVRGPAHDAGLPGSERDILDDEDSEEETGSRSFVGQPQEFAPPTLCAPGPMALRHRRDVSGHPSRSSILRC